MKITNNLNLPSPVIEALDNDPYSPGECDITVTRLISPPRMVALTYKNRDKISRDASDMVFALLGQAMHAIMERADKEAITEQRLYIDRFGWRIGGQFDRVVVNKGLLQDYKVTTAYTIRDGAKEEWKAQINILATILREHGHKIKSASIVYFLRDWRKSRAENDDEYPPAMAGEIPIELWPEETVEEYIYDRVLKHQAAERELPLCSDEDCWKRPTYWALWKKGNKRPTKVFKSESEAQAAFEEAKAKKGEFYIETREGEYVRCEGYCDVAEFCEQRRQRNAKLEQSNSSGASDAQS